MTEELTAGRQAGKSWSGAWLARIVFAGFLLFVILTGSYVGGAGLHDPDTCWLLALGRRIWQTGAIPGSDPFSYTFGLNEQVPVLVAYQWLSELLFFLAYKTGGLVLLLAFAAVVFSLAFIAVPTLMLARTSLGELRSMGLTLLAVFAASFHSLVRPEIFSYMFLGLWAILIDAMIVKRNTVRDMDWRLVAIIAVSMVFWCNLHTGFVLGLLALAFFLAAELVLSLAGGSSGLLHKTGLASLFAALAASLANPFGTGLWDYLPHLFFMPINRQITEVRPLGTGEFADPQFYPFFILVGIAILMAVRCLIRKQLILSPRTVYVILAVSAIVAGFLSRRLIPFMVPFIVLSVGRLYRPARRTEGGAFAKALRGLYRPAGFIWITTVAALSALGSWLMSTTMITPTLPQGSLAFSPPVEAVKFIEKNKPAGRLFNDAQYGDMLIWNLDGAVKVFIDTRYDIYPDDVTADYLRIIRCGDRWQDLLAKYDISWAFLPAQSTLAGELEAGNWHRIYGDDTAVILVRQ